MSVARRLPTTNRLMAVLDTDDAAAAAVAAQAGSIDICVNVITHGDVQGTPFVEMALEDYLRPVDTAVRTTFLTSRAAGRHMVRQGSGVILAFGGSGDPPRDDYLGGLQVAFETMRASSSPCSGGGPPWRTSATWPPSWPPTGPAP